MRTISQLSALNRLRTPVVLAAGFFDGVHRGHRAVISRTLERAREIGGQAWVLTFDTHPLKVLAPCAAPLLLTANPHKLGLLDSLGVDGCLLLPFSRSLAAMPPLAFVRLLRRNIPSLAEVFVGRNWRFGHQGKGTPALLGRLGRAMGFRVTVVDPVVFRGTPVSSSRIRRHVLLGELARASALLGRPFSVRGTVVRGRGIGRRMGFPTANLDLHDEVRPPNGVYAIQARLFSGGRERAVTGIANLGLRPTFQDSQAGRATLEVHFFDLSRRLYGADVEVSFMRRLRNERPFHSLAALQNQIARDILRARRLLAKREPEDRRPKTAK